MAERMYVIVVGAGKVGWNLGRELLEKGNELTLIENDRDRFLTVEQELEHNIQYGDASELWVLERAGISRADLVIAVTGDDDLPEGSLLISVLREGRGFVPGPDTVLEPGDEVLAVLDPGVEEDVKAFFSPDGSGE